MKHTNGKSKGFGTQQACIYMVLIHLLVELSEANYNILNLFPSFV